MLRNGVFAFQTTRGSTSAGMAYNLFQSNGKSFRIFTSGGGQLVPDYPDKIALIPWDKDNDPFGHADGMVRFIDNDTVLLQGYFDTYDEKFKKQLYDSLEFNGLTWKKMNYEVENENDRNWAYMNFLQTKDLIIVPAIGIDEDEQALKQIRGHFPDYDKNDKIRQVDMADIEQEGGGVLNCISWTIEQ